MASAGTITVDFAAETAKFTNDLRGVQVALKKLEGDFKAVDRVAGVALRFLSGVALANFAKQAFSAADAAADAAERAGIAVDSFTRLQFAAGQADVEMGALTSGIQRFQVAISKADDEGREAIATLSRLGVEIEDIRSLPIEGQLASIADAFKQIRDPADRTRLAVELFGRSAGPQLVPLLARGRDGIRELAAEADRLGVTMSNSTALGIGEADKALKRLIATSKSAVADVLGRLSILLSPPKDEAGRLAVQIDALARERRAILNAIEAGDRNAGSGFLGQKTLQEINAELATLETRLRSINEATVGDQRMQLLPLPWTQLQEIDISAIQGLKIEVDDLAEAYRQLDIATRDIQIERSTEALEIATSAAVEQQRALEQAVTQAISEELEQRSQLQQFYRDQQYQNELLVQQQLQQARQQALNSALAGLQSFAGGSKKAAIALVAINKGLAIAKAVQDGFVAVQNALAYVPYPANLAAAAQIKALTAINIAGIAASGFGQIQSINSNPGRGAPIGSPVNPVFTNDAAQQFGATSQSAIQIVIANNVGFDQRVMDQIIEGIREAADERDVIIFGPESRQAKEIIVNG